MTCFAKMGISWWSDDHFLCSLVRWIHNWRGFILQLASYWSPFWAETCNTFLQRMRDQQNQMLMQLISSQSVWSCLCDSTTLLQAQIYYVSYPIYFLTAPLLFSYSKQKKWLEKYPRMSFGNHMDQKHAYDSSCEQSVVPWVSNFLPCIVSK